jgi:hypothetical protein
LVLILQKKRDLAFLCGRAKSHLSGIGDVPRAKKRFLIIRRVQCELKDLVGIGGCSEE